jgi:hypothetical protein
VYSAAVVKLKTLTSLLAADEQQSNKTVENMRMMQKILVYIVTIISNFMDLEPAATRISRVVSTTVPTPPNKYLATVTPNTTRRYIPDRNWQQKAIVSVMEAGGVNWLVGKVGFSMFTYSLLYLLLPPAHDIRYYYNQYAQGVTICFGTCLGQLILVYI